MAAEFLSIGECMVEMAPQATGGYALSFAGDTFNTAWYMRQLADPEIRVGYLSAVGDDAISQQMRDFVATAGVTPHLPAVPGRSVGLYVISLDNGERSFSYWRDTSAARCLAQNLNPVAALKAGDMAYFSGITLAILTPQDRVLLLDALRAARARGITIAFDPNLRSRLWKSADEMRQAVMAGAAVSDIALPSFEDEATVFGDADQSATAARYLDAGAALVVVKDGADPVLVFDREGARETVQPRVNTAPVDTTAAGDSFNAGFLDAFIRGQNMAAAATAGCALSHHVVGRQGALVALASAG